MLLFASVTVAVAGRPAEMIGLSIVSDEPAVVFRINSVGPVPDCGATSIWPPLIETDDDPVVTSAPAVRIRGPPSVIEVAAPESIKKRGDAQAGRRDRARIIARLLDHQVGHAVTARAGGNQGICLVRSTGEALRIGAFRQSGDAAGNVRGEVNGARWRGDDGVGKDVRRMPMLALTVDLPRQHLSRCGEGDLVEGAADRRAAARRDEVDGAGACVPRVRPLK